MSKTEQSVQARSTPLHFPYVLACFAPSSTDWINQLFFCFQWSAEIFITRYNSY